MTSERDHFWPIERAKTAVETLLVHSGMPLAVATTLGFQGGEGREGTDINWLRRAPRMMGVDVRLDTLSFEKFVTNLDELAGPCVVAALPEPMQILALIIEPGGRARVVRPDAGEVKLSRLSVVDLVASAIPGSPIDDVFDGLPGGQSALRALRAAGVGESQVVVARFEPDPAHPVWRQLAYARAWRSLGHYLAALCLAGAAAGLALWTLGSAALDGHVDWGRMAAWSMLAMSDVPLQYLANRALGKFAILLGSRMHRRILEGTFRIDEREVRKQGYGTLIARANEAHFIRISQLGQIVSVIVSVGQLVIAGVLLERTVLFGPMMAIHLVAFGAAILIGVRLFKRSVETHRLRLQLTDDQVDKIIGHRTRAVQEAPRHYHVGEDQKLSDYLRVSQRMDGLRAISRVFSRLWITTSGTLLIGAFVLEVPTWSLAWATVALLFSARGFAGLLLGTERVAEWYSAYQGLRSLVDVGGVRGRAPSENGLATDGMLPVVLTISSVSYAYRVSGRPVFEDAQLQVRSGERVLVVGPSGGGKSTLLKLIAGELRPSAGIILVGGADAQSTSEAVWRRLVASAPQFHENHIFAQTFAFNIDPSAESSSASPEAQAVCHELGLEPLIRRMPQGYRQLLGETGWQLSHGERSRIFIARALLQQGKLVLLDESFGALDPETQLRAIECARQRAKTLMVIAHV